MKDDHSHAARYACRGKRRLARRRMSRLTRCVLRSTLWPPSTRQRFGRIEAPVCLSTKNVFILYIVLTLVREPMVLAHHGWFCWDATCILVLRHPPSFWPSCLRIEGKWGAQSSVTVSAYDTSVIVLPKAQGETFLGPAWSHPKALHERFGPPEVLGRLKTCVSTIGEIIYACAGFNLILMASFNCTTVWVLKLTDMKIMRYSFRYKFKQRREDFLPLAGSFQLRPKLH